MRQREGEKYRLPGRKGVCEEAGGRYNSICCTSGLQPQRESEETEV